MVNTYLILIFTGPCLRPEISSYTNSVADPTDEVKFSSSVPLNVISAFANHWFLWHCAVFNDELLQDPFTVTTVQTGLSMSVTFKDQFQHNRTIYFIEAGKPELIFYSCSDFGVGVTRKKTVKVNKLFKKDVLIKIS